ncbi:hypothetical protein [Novosphingobium olei]|uniref:Uncharacterized protein n=1 Tax=Novosphingobium olei TaxID=2728851 RepID=A0A7Y0BNK9_9SPHN|nr:hypothetical protein [Novosphingobium olei]NML93806.1 hypothetical protein [Novosphingobium olei]
MRKHKTVTIDAEGRDKGKSFLIVEKSAWETEKWALQALSVLAKSGMEIPDDVASAGAIGLLAVGLEAFKRAPYQDVEPLMAAMVDCISFVPDVSAKDPMTGLPITRALMVPDKFNDGDISEIATLLKLRAEVLELHLGFSITAALSGLSAAVTASNQQNSSTPPGRAARSSQRAKRA